MTNFAFPPPPPPPPRATPDTTNSTSYDLQRYRSGRGGGGNFRGRGRGDHHAGRGQYASQSRGRAANIQQSYRPTNFLPEQNHSPMPQQSPFAPYANFEQYSRNNSQAVVGQTGHSQTGQIAWSQPQSVYGISSGNLQPLNYPRSYPPQNFLNQNSFYPPNPPRIQHQLESNEVNETHGPTTFHPHLQNGREIASSSRGRGHENFRNRGKTAVAPSVPSFGAALPLTKTLDTTSSPTDGGAMEFSKQSRKRKRTTNQLGLTPKGEEYEGSEEEMDEEAAFSTNGGPLQIEYKGKVSVLGNTSDIKAWIEERRNRYPTKARIEQKLEEVGRRQAEQAEARRKAQESQLKARSQRQEQSCGQGRQIKIEKSDSKNQNIDRNLRGDEKLKKKLEKHLAKAEKLRKALEKSGLENSELGKTSPDRITDEASKAAVTAEHVPLATDNERTTGNHPQTEEEGSLSDADALHTLTETQPSVTADTSITAIVSDDNNNEINNVSSPAPSSSLDSSSDTDTDASATSDGESSSSAPEEETTKSNGPIRVPAPPRQNKTRICKYFLSKGSCRNGDRCNFLHERPVRAEQGTLRLKKERQTNKKERKSLYQKMVEQEQAEENRVALQAIKYLGEHGFFADLEASQEDKSGLVN